MRSGSLTLASDLIGSGFIQTKHKPKVERKVTQGMVFTSRFTHSLCFTVVGVVVVILYDGQLLFLRMGRKKTSDLPIPYRMMLFMVMSLIGAPMWKFVL